MYQRKRNTCVYSMKDMNFTCLHISKYTHVQQQLALCFKEEGFCGYYRPGHMMELYVRSVTN